MKILFDMHVTQSYGTTKFHGGGRYGQNLLRAFLSHEGIQTADVDICVTKKEAVDFPDDLASLMKSQNVQVFEISEHSEIPGLIKREGVELFYSALPDTYVKYINAFPSGVRYIGTIHGPRDLEIHYTPLYVSYQKKMISRLRQRMREIFRERYEQNVIDDFSKVFSLFKDGIITVSEHSRHQIKLSFKDVSQNIKVFFPIHFDYDVEIQNNDSPVPGSYFLCLNANRPVKNILAVMKAVQQFSIQGIENKSFLCVGFTGYQKQLIRKKYPKAFEKCIFFDYVIESKLLTLYANAFALLFPSVNEGFGYPPLEAMRFGTPVIASAVSAIPEVCGDAALYFNPYDIREIANRLQYFATEKTVQEQLRVNGNERYSWYLAKINEQREELLDFLISKI